MDRRDFLALGAAGLAGRALRPSWLVPADVAAAGVPASTTADRMQWRDARFGMFVHLGLYSVPGGEWKGKFVGSHEWMRNNAKVPHEEYIRLRAGPESDGARRRRHRAHGQGGGAAVRGGHYQAPRGFCSGRVR